MTDSIYKLLAEALDFILPSRCVICGARKMPQENAMVLAEQYKKCATRAHKYYPDVVSSVELNFCFACISSLVPVPIEKRWLLCLSEPFTGDEIPGLTLYVPFTYNSVVSSGIRQMKFAGKYEIAIFYGMLLGRSLRSDKVEVDAIIPVPLSSKRLSERHYNQAMLMAISCACFLNKPLLADVLRRSKNTKRQTECKSNAHRAENVKSAFEVSDEWSIEGMRLLLVDDVATTGNTLHEGSLALFEKGAENVLCCAFASNRVVKNNEIF